MDNHYVNYMWLYKTIKDNPGIRLKEISEMWKECEYSGGAYLPPRTFNDWKNRIEELLNVEIVCERRGVKSGYTVKTISNLYGSHIDDWLVSSLSISTQVSDAKKMHERIQLEDIPSGDKYLLPIIEAMKKKKCITMIYQKFVDDEPKERHLEAYCVKVFEKRWYVVGRDMDIDKIRTFALDRIQSLKTTKEKYKFPKTFSVKDHFKYSYGIYGGEQFPPELIKMKAYGIMKDLLRTLPLHSSQREIQKEKDYSIFTVTMGISFDLKQYFLAQGSDIEILEPESLRNSIHNMLQEACERYTK